MSLAIAVGWILIGAALLGACYALAAAAAVERFFVRPLKPTGDFPSVTLLKPLHGAEPLLAETLEGFCRQDYPAPVQIVFGVQGDDDAAIPIVKELIARHPEIDIALAISPRRELANPKISNLIGMMPQAKHDLLVLSDSDIGVTPDYLRKVASALAEPGVGAVTCVYRGHAAGGLWSRLAVMGIDYQFLPSVIFGTALGLAKPCFGSTIALRRSVLNEIGGFVAFQDRLADDYEIGNAVRAKGYKVALPPFAVTHNCSEQDAAGLFRHELRWARTIRSVDGWGFAGSIITHALPLALIGASLLHFRRPALVAFLLVLVARLMLKLRIDHMLGRPGPSSLLIPLRDVLSFAVFLGSFFTRQVDWRGSRYRVHEDGQLARE